MLLNPFIYRTSALDADVQAFLTATGISDPTISTALNTLVPGLKTDGLWTKLPAIYPIVGGSAATHKYNLKDPRDLDAAFRLTLAGTVTHNSSGMHGDGSTGYGNTHLTPSSDLPTNEGSNGSWLTVYQSSGFGLNASDGCRTTGNKIFIYTPCWGDNNVYFGASGASGSTPFTTFGSPVSDLCQNVRKDASNSSFQIGTIRYDYSSAYDAPNINSYVMAENTNGVTSFFCPAVRIYKFHFIGKALTNTEMTNLRNRVATFQSDLGR